MVLPIPPVPPATAIVTIITWDENVHLVYGRCGETRLKLLNQQGGGSPSLKYILVHHSRMEECSAGERGFEH